MIELLTTCAAELGLDCSVQLRGGDNLVAQLDAGTVYLRRARRGGWYVTRLHGSVGTLMHYVGSLGL